MDLICNNYYCGILVAIFYFPHSFYIYHLEVLHKKELSHLQHLFIQPYHLFIHHEIMDISLLFFFFGLKSNTIIFVAHVVLALAIGSSFKLAPVAL